MLKDSIPTKKAWTSWHQRLHKELIRNKSLLPDGATLLLAVSGGQDSMALLKLIIDLNRLHKWHINIWHGNHGWHNQATDIEEGLREWCKNNSLKFYSNQADPKLINSESKARDWRYSILLETAKLIGDKTKDSFCQHIVTGHTASDQTETLILNLARGTDLQGLSSLKAKRLLEGEITLTRPLLYFSREETSQICKELELPIWIDPTNSNMDLRRNRVRKDIIPILEEIHPGCSMRIAELATRIGETEDQQNEVLDIALKSLIKKEGLCRKNLSKIKISTRMKIIARWLKKNNVPRISRKQIKQINRIGELNEKHGSIDLAEDWKVIYTTDSIKLEKVNR